MLLFVHMFYHYDTKAQDDFWHVISNVANGQAEKILQTNNYVVLLCMFSHSNP